MENGGETGEGAGAGEKGGCVNQHNYSLMQTTPHCLYPNELMRLQTGGRKKKKKSNSITRCLLQATEENELSPDLNGDGGFHPGQN